MLSFQQSDERQQVRRLEMRRRFSDHVTIYAKDSQYQRSGSQSYTHLQTSIGSRDIMCNRSWKVIYNRHVWGHLEPRCAKDGVYYTDELVNLDGKPGTAMPPATPP